MTRKAITKLKKYISEDKQQTNLDDTFEGEETLGGEFRDNASPPETDTTRIYPDALVNIASESASVFQLKRKHEKIPPLIKLDPDFQRHAVWSPKHKSELIESILMGIPLPLIYVKEDDKGVYIIVDGRQRLTTLFQFMNHEFSLQKLTILTSLNGAYFSESTKNGTKFETYLTQAQQSKIEDCPLTLHVIKPPTHDRVTFDLFDRVNRGGTRLNNQEMSACNHTLIERRNVNGLGSSRSTTRFWTFSGVDSLYICYDKPVALKTASKVGAVRTSSLQASSSFSFA